MRPKNIVLLAMLLAETKEYLLLASFAWSRDVCSLKHLGKQALLKRGQHKHFAAMIAKA